MADELEQRNSMQRQWGHGLKQRKIMQRQWGHMLKQQESMQRQWGHMLKQQVRSQLRLVVPPAQYMRLRQVVCHPLHWVK